MQRTCRCWSQSANSSLFSSIGLGDKAVTSSDHWVWQRTFVFHSPTIHNMKVTSESTFSKTTTTTTTKSRRGKEWYMSLFFCECSPWWINRANMFEVREFRIAYVSYCRRPSTSLWIKNSKGVFKRLCSFRVGNALKIDQIDFR